MVVDKLSPSVSVVVDFVFDVFDFWFVVGDFVADEMGMVDLGVVVVDFGDMGMNLQLEWLRVKRWDWVWLGNVDSVDMVSVVVLKKKILKTNK